MIRGRWGKLLAALVVALAVAGAALAYFTSTGSGSGSATVGTAQDLTFHGGTPTTELFPAHSGDIDLLVDNPNTFSVHLNGLVLKTSEGTGGFAINGGGHAGCVLSALSFNGPQTNGGSGWDIPAGNDNPVNLPGAISLSASADTDCQGATFNVYLQAAP